MTGQGTLAGLFTRELFPVGMASPRGILPFTMRGAVVPQVA